MPFTHTYTGDPANQERDAVRFLIGDIDNTDWQITDETITWALTEEGNIYLAAALCAKSIGSTFARAVEKTIGDLKISNNQKSQQYMDLAKQLEMRGAMRAGTIFATGQTVSGKKTAEQDTSRVAPNFQFGMDDNPEADKHRTNRRLRDDI